MSPAPPRRPYPGALTPTTRPYAPLPLFNLGRLPRLVELAWRYGGAKKFANLFAAERALIRREVRPTARPYLFRADPDSECDVNCPYCWQTLAPPRPAAKLSLAAFRAGFDPFADRLLLTFFHFFGEPTWNDELPAMIAHAHRSRSATYLSTNLQRDDDAYHADLLASGLDLLTINLDAATPATYRRMKPRADYDRLRRNIELIVAKRRTLRRPPHLVFQVLVTRFNEPELPMLRELARRWGADNLDLKPTGFLPDDSWLPLDRRYHLVQNPPGRISCAQPWTNLTLLADGRYFPCCAFPGDFALAAAGADAETVWNGEAMPAIRAGFRAGDLHEFCRECPVARIPRF